MAEMKNEWEVETLETAVIQIASIVKDLTQEKTEMERRLEELAMRLEELERVRASLVNVIDQLRQGSE